MTNKKAVKKAYLRIYDKKQKEKFEEIKEFIDNHSNKYGKQSVLEFCLNQAYSDIEDIKKNLP